MALIQKALAKNHYNLDLLRLKPPITFTLPDLQTPWRQRFQSITMALGQDRYRQKEDLACLKHDSTFLGNTVNRTPQILGHHDCLQVV